MSYSCTISFKQIKPEEIYPFLQKLKEEATKVAPDIIKDEYIWSSIYKWMGFDEEKKALIKDGKRFFTTHNEDVVRVERENEDWIIRCFTFRWYWDFEKSVLMLYSIPKQLQHLFDNTVYFQDSCDQDYDFDEWSGIPYMEDIANKWKNMSNEGLVKAYKDSRYFSENEDDDYIKENQDYYRKSFCYEEIWDRIEWTLYNDKDITYITLFSKWNDYDVLKRCNIATVEGIKEDWIDRYDKKDTVENDKYYQAFKDLGIPVEPFPPNYNPEEYGRRLLAMSQPEYGVSYVASTDYTITQQKTTDKSDKVEK